MCSQLEQDGEDGSVAGVELVGVEMEVGVEVEEVMEDADFRATVS